MEQNISERLSKGIAELKVKQEMRAALYETWNQLVEYMALCIAIKDCTVINSEFLDNKIENAKKCIDTLKKAIFVSLPE